MNKKTAAFKALTKQAIINPALKRPFHMLQVTEILRNFGKRGMSKYGCQIFLLMKLSVINDSIVTVLILW